MVSQVTTIKSGADIGENHPELFHYTNWVGLSGILSSQQLWATHYKHLNDTTEIDHVKESLVDAVSEPFTKRLEATDDERIVAVLRRYGGAAAVARSETTKIVEAMHQAAFTGVSKGQPLATPFICSFCSHASDTPYERENGLLSQWRSYGGEAGFALIFDGSELELLSKREFQNYSYHVRIFEPIVYNRGEKDFRIKFEGLLTQIENFMWRHLVEMRDWELPSDLVTNFLVAAITFKHLGFKEENEVRLAMCPTSHFSRERTRASHPEDHSLKKPLKQIHNRGTGSNDLFYIKLFDFPEIPRLPIKRIIVGPHTEQLAFKERVVSLVQNSIPVSCSRTPFVGRASSSRL